MPSYQCDQKHNVLIPIDIDVPVHWLFLCEYKLFFVQTNSLYILSSASYQVASKLLWLVGSGCLGETPLCVWTTSVDIT